MTLRPNSIEARDAAHILHPYTNAAMHEQEGGLVISRGAGIYVFDADGNRYIEGLSGLFCASLGFSEQRLVEAATRQMNKLPFYHTFCGVSNEPSIELAERLIALAPWPMSKVFFANSGSEINDTAMKLVWYYHNAIGKPHKKKIISRVRAYHGVTVASASLTGLPGNHQDFDLPLGRVLHTDCPGFYRYGLPGESEHAFVDRCVASLEALIEREGADTIGAFFAEPLMASGGCIVPPPGYYEKVQAVLRKHEILFIADEVICGFGRLGTMFGCQSFDIEPDMISMAKQLSAGYQPISALMMNEKVYRGVALGTIANGALGHGFTYSGHPVAAAVALEALNIYEERDIIGHVRSIAPQFQEILRAFSNHPLVGEARGMGLIGTLELVAEKATRRPFDASRAVAARVGARARTHGVMTRALGDAVALCPPLIITSTEIDSLMDGIKLALDETYDEVRSA